jgi:imidazolonepropionase-like amidohydrolase
VTVLHARGILDVDTGDVIVGAYVVVEDGRITSVGTDASVASDADEVLELPDLTLIPGLMDMEVNLILGGPGAGLTDPVVTDPVKMTLRATVNARRTLRAGFTTVRNLGLFVRTGGYLLDVALSEAVEAGWVDGPRIVPAGHAICPTGGHLDPSAQSGLAPHMMPLSVEEGIADGVDQVRRAVRYQIKHGAQVIGEVCASGGVVSLGPPGAQQYSNEELAAIADEAHRRGLKVAAHAHGDEAVNAALDAGIDCIEHGFMIADDTIQRLVDTDTFLVSTTALTENWDISKQPPHMKANAEEIFPKAKESLSKCIEAGVKIACGSDAPAIWHGRNAEEIVVLVKRGMTPLQAIRAATTVSAELIDAPDLGRIAPDMHADIIGVPGDPLTDITTLQQVRFVMKGGTVYKR